MSDSLPAPITREDYYLATLCGVYSGDLPAPITREDNFLLYRLVTNGALSDGQIVRGRNYLLNTRELTATAGKTAWSSTYWTLEEDAAGFGVLTIEASGVNSPAVFFTQVDASEDAWAGKDIVFSCDVKASDLTSGAYTAYFRIYGSNNGTSWGMKYSSASKSFQSTSNDYNRADWADNEWVRLTFKFTGTAAADMTESTTTSYTYLYYAFCVTPSSSNTTGTLSIRKPKLEIGTVPTDWTPAPEDGELPTPITRTDRYLAYLCGVYDGDLPSPITRKDYYLAALCGTYDGDLPTPITREDYYLSQLVADGGYCMRTKLPAA